MRCNEATEADKAAEAKDTLRKAKTTGGDRIVANQRCCL